MERWVIYALISMLFAGITSVIAKYGMKNVSGDTALTVRTSMVFILVWANAFALNNVNKLRLLTQKDILFLCLSGAENYQIFYPVTEVTQPYSH